MTTDVRVKTTRSSHSRRSFAEETVVERLRAHSDRISHASLLLDDVNGPRGGRDKQCRIVVRLYKRAAVVVEHRSSDWYEAVAGACASARVAVRKEFGRRRRRREVRQVVDEAA